MSYQYQHSPYLESPSPEAPKRSLTVPLIFFIIFIVAGIVLVILLIYWFVLRTPDTGQFSCKSPGDCLPNQICTNNVCDGVQCTLDSQCESALPGSFCVLPEYSQQGGFCQFRDCSSNADCGAGDVCLSFNTGTKNSRSACVPLPDKCVGPGAQNCYRGSKTIAGRPLACTDNKCVECVKNTDCSTTGLCVDGVCSYCNSADDCTSAGGKCGTNGVCCDQYSYSPDDGATGRCGGGEDYDYCNAHSQCKSNNCIDYLTGGGQKVCAPSNAKCLFSRNTILNNPLNGENIDPALVCSSSDLAFCVAGTCSNISVSRAGVGSSCGIPDKCSNDYNTSTNLLCAQKLIFNNPYYSICNTSMDDCNLLGNFDCENQAGLGTICTKQCTSVNDCDVGQVCGPDANKTDTSSCANGSCHCWLPNPPPTKNTEGNAVVVVECSSGGSNPPVGYNPSAVCPKDYSCVFPKDPSLYTESIRGECAYSNDVKDSTQSGISLIQNNCSTPANYLNPLNASTGGASYCVSGYCSTVPGWVGNTCSVTNDCLFISGDGTRQTSFVCKPNGTTGNIINYCELTGL